MRKSYLITVIACVLLAFGILAASGQTPDGKMPADEGICDFLQDHTPGLYGLCVAYCEAHDVLEKEMPLDRFCEKKEMRRLVKKLKPSNSRIQKKYKSKNIRTISRYCEEIVKGHKSNIAKVLENYHTKLLQNYREKIQISDPDMPCVAPTECPCFDETDIAVMDTPIDRSYKRSPDLCRAENDQGYITDQIEDSYVDNNFLSIIEFKTVLATPITDLRFRYSCSQDRTRYRGTSGVSINLRITADEYYACRSLIINRGQQDGVSGEYWDCWE